jgi:hypothetical protein
MTGGILQTLHKVDEKAYYGVANHIIKHTLKVAEAFGTEDKSEDGEQLVIAAKLINKFIYKTTKIDDPPQIQATEQKEDPEKEKFQREKSEFNQQRLNAATSDVGGRITKDIERAVNKYIDPRGSMNDYTKERAVKDVMSRLDSEIGKDPRFKAVMGQLWKKASENGFPEDVKKQIHQNAINKAQTLLAGIIKGVRSEALKGQGKKVSLSPKKSEDDETSERRSSPPKQSSSKYDKEKEKPRARSVNDVMNFLNKG